jgi:hypothetical protein
VNSDNSSSADNQQERSSSSNWLYRIPDDLGHWISGFVDGEGSFNVPFRRERDRGLPWRVSLSFNVSQVGQELPELLKSTFDVGTVRGRSDGVFYFEVTRPKHLEDRVFPFFERFALRGSKAGDLLIFRQITQLVRLGRHLAPSGIREIMNLRSPMNNGGKRRYVEQEILDVLRNWESSEAIRRAPSRSKMEEDMVHAL